MQTVIITGRSMVAPLLNIADTVSEVQDKGHAFRLDVAQAGIGSDGQRAVSAIFLAAFVRPKWPPLRRLWHVAQAQR